MPTTTVSAARPAGARTGPTFSLVRQLRLKILSHDFRSVAHCVLHRAWRETSVAAREPGIGRVRVAREDDAQGLMAAQQVLDTLKLLLAPGDGAAGAIASQCGLAHFEKPSLGLGIELPELLEDGEQELESVADGQAHLRPGILGVLNAGDREAQHPELRHRSERDFACAPMHKRRETLRPLTASEEAYT